MLLVLLGLAPMIALAVYAYQRAATATYELVAANNVTAATMSAEFTGREFTVRTTAIVGFARNPGFIAAVRDRDEGGVRARLRVLVESDPVVVRAFVTDPDGMLWSDYPRAPESLGENFSHRDWYRGLSAAWEPYVSRVYRRHAEPRLLLVAIAAPVRDQGSGAVIGAIVYQIRLEGITRLIQQIDVGHGGFMLLVDHGGTVAAHPHLDLQQREYRDYAEAEPVVLARRGETGATSYPDPISGEAMLATAMPVSIGSAPWVVVAQQPVEEAYAPVHRLALQIGVAGTLLAFVTGTLLFGLALSHNRLQRLGAHLARTNRELEAVNEELHAFSYSVSHDLRAPLRSLDGFSQALLTEYPERLDAQGRHYLQRVRAAAVHMGQLIDDLLMLSRVTRSGLQRTAVDLSAIAYRVAAELREREPERDGEFVVTGGLRADGDPRLVRIALQNLLDNAWKFTRPCASARIEFGHTFHNGRHAYFVRDNGVGFDMTYSDKLFAAFQRLHGAREFSGTGIGLAIVQRVVHKHGGRIWAEGEPGKGAVFYFTL